MFMAAFRGRSFFRGFFPEVGVVAVAAVSGFCSGTGRDFWASRSGILILAASCVTCACGLRVSWTCGFGPAIDVSGMPVFRGGIGNSGMV